MNYVKEIVAKVIFTLAALISVIAIVLICGFLFANGIPAIKKIGAGNFIFGTVVDIIPKSDNKTMYKVIPNIGCSNALLPKLKKYYIISDNNTFLITVKKKS